MATDDSLFVMEDDGVDELLGDLVHGLEVDCILIQSLQLDMKSLPISKRPLVRQ